MRDYQQQLVDLQNVVIAGMTRIKRMQLIKYAYPIVLEEYEGVIVRDLLELIAIGDKDKSGKILSGSVFFERSPVFCSLDFPLPDHG